ncbi:hypothetical protein N8D56_12245 [Devosia sp. A8/3-2]|nr:hypothetical protein N8D56_12245 [Devosia sp. A8/3-2]
MRWGLPVGLALVFLYLVFCWFFFSVGPALQNGRWDRAAIYVQDWYSGERSRGCALMMARWCRNGRAVGNIRPMRASIG